MGNDSYHKQSRLRHTVIAVGALIMLSAMLLSSGLTGFVLQEIAYKSDEPETLSVEQVEELPVLSVPVIVHRVRNTSKISTKRTNSEISKVIQQSAEIWSHAKIGLEVRIINTKFTESEASLIAKNDYSPLYSKINPSKPAIHIFLIKNLGFPSGLAIPGGIGLVADFTHENDFRTTAHEIGHLLGLSHSPESRTRLMHPGASGVELITDEVVLARSLALNYR